MYGGSTTSILVRIPGEAASVVTCVDGYEMARNGRAGPALMIGVQLRNTWSYKLKKVPSEKSDSPISMV